MFNNLLKILVLPFTLISIPFKILDWVFKIVGLIFLMLMLYFLNWIPAYTDFVNSTFPDFARSTQAIRLLFGVSQNIPTEKLQKAAQSTVDIINN